MIRTKCPACRSLLQIDFEVEADVEVLRIAKPNTGAFDAPRSPHRAAVEVICRVAAEHGFALVDLRGISRASRIALARREAVIAARRETDASLTDIGNILNRHHTTVLSLARYAQKREAA